ncbi:MAG TPA: dipeptide epimerase [Ktedonobacterales bacterium]|jgi:L-alanine-DL-glutamate epimerase-like enolase superfamily enzyme
MTKKLMGEKTMLKLETALMSLKLTEPFRISRGVQHFTQQVVVHLHGPGQVGLGEAAPSSFYGENQETVLACLATYAEHLGDDPFALEEILTGLENVIHRNAAARAAVDMALYDLVGKLLGVPVYKLLGVNPAKTPCTSFTIGLDTPAEMARKAEQAKDFPILKVKLGSRQDLDCIKAIRDVSNATIRVDANTGWTLKEAIKLIEALEPYQIEFVEQPLPPSDLEGLRLLREHSPLPIFADESCVTLEDIPRVVGCVDGINIKLMKCGGIRQALKMIHAARAHHLQIMLGCMIESSLAITAAAHLSPLVDYADLDGHLLVDNDPYQGVQVETGKLVLPAGPGLGVLPTPAIHSL